MNITQLRAAYDTAKERLVAARDAIEAADEAADFQALETELDEAAAEVERTKTNFQARERVEKLIEDNPVVERVAERVSERVSVKVGREELTYRPDDAARGRSFFRDAFAAQYRHDTAAAERLQRNTIEQNAIVREKLGAGAFIDPDREQRDVGTSAFSGLVVPQYLVDLAAPLARAGSPLINALSRKIQLPDDGLTLNISRITTGSAVAAQATENSAVQETDMDDTLLTINVRTYAGQQDLSRQVIERGTKTDQITYEDLVRAYFTKLDSAIINDDGTSGTHLGIRSTSGIVAVTYTDASPTVPELYPKIGSAKYQIAEGIFTQPYLMVMKSRRWEWILSAQDSSTRPLAVPEAQGPFNALAVGEAMMYGQVRGRMHELPVITDDNIPTNLGAGTNEDVVLVLSTPELYLWWEGDGMPRRFQFDQVAPPQSIRLAVWGYSAFTAGRYPLAAAVISGTGLVAPTL